MSSSARAQTHTHTQVVLQSRCLCSINQFVTLIDLYNVQNIHSRIDDIMFYKYLSLLKQIIDENAKLSNINIS